jgi:excisionase family DNA binding protein
MTDLQGIDGVIVEWARHIPLDQVPRLLAFLSARLLAESHSSRSCAHDRESRRDAEKLLTAGQLAERLALPESWVRSEERAGRIASVRLGKYVRFRLSDVERGLAQRGR